MIQIANHPNKKAPHFHVGLLCDYLALHKCKCFTLALSKCTLTLPNNPLLLHISKLEGVYFVCKSTILLSRDHVCCKE